MTDIVLGGRSLTRAALPPGVTSKHIAITGTTPSRMQCPFKDEKWNPPNGEIWTIGPGGHDITPWHALIEIHGPTTWPETFAAYLANMKATLPPKRIFTLEPVPEWPANFVLPRSEWFEEYDKGWVSSSIAYGIIQAFREGATDIGLWGIDLEAGEEYVAQKMGCRHFIDLFRSQGVNFHVPEGCGLQDDPSPYPDRWEKHTAHKIQAKIESTQNIIGGMTQQHANIVVTNHHKQGYIAAIEGKMTEANLPKIKEDLANGLMEEANLAAQLHGHHGALSALTYVRSQTMIGNPGE